VSVLPAQEAQKLIRGLESSDPSTVAAVLAPALAATYRATPSSFLPAGSTVSINVEQLRVAGDVATVPADVSGTLPGHFLLLLERVHSQWLIYGTTKR
jgi:hypothetical protein